MIHIGKVNKLKVIRTNGENITFDAEEYGEIEALNNDFVLKYNEGDVVNVFIYPDGENLKACIGEAYANANEFVKLKVVSNTKIGTFFDWGIDKDIFCPFKEQKTELEVNHYYLVYIYLDEETNRLAASTKIEKFILDETPNIQENQSVNIFILNKSQLGYNAIVENKYRGLLYNNEVFAELKPGQKLTAIVRKIREDNKIDLRLFKNDYGDISNFEEQIIDYLKSHDGKMSINDESDPEIIYKAFGISKKNFKKALGALYRKEIIDLKDTNVKLLKDI
jgi:predicted RNA-binding protein (virulence factor B family)